MLIAVTLITYLLSLILAEEAVNSNQFDKLLSATGKLQNNNKNLTRIIRNTKHRVRKKIDCSKVSNTESSPYIAIILSKTSGQYLCMGSILDTYNILSAKNCFKEEEGDDYYVLAGYFKAYWGRYSQVKKVDRIHKNRSDLVILKLKHPLEFSRTVKQVTLPPENLEVVLPSRDIGCQLGIYGFPLSKWDEPGYPIPNKNLIYILDEAAVITTAECEKVYKEKLPPETNFSSNDLSCLKAKGKFCWGAMGSPVMGLHESSIILLGVVILAGCNDSDDYPMLNSRVSPLIRWIEANSKARSSR